MNLKRLGAKQMTLPEPEQFKVIVKTMKTAEARQSKDCADLVRFLALSGYHISETQQVTGADVDLEYGEIRDHNAKHCITTSAHGMRFVAIITAMRELLECMHQQQTLKPTDCVCVRGECEKSLTIAYKNVGATRIANHDLRHLLATRCPPPATSEPRRTRKESH
ncbi:MAG: site-specific integrase [Verrucomicrobiota bacterium]